jgi:vacuolar iron transporter family protein
MVGVAAAGSNRSAVLIAGIAGLTAGSMAMAAGEYVSVSSQRDTERADLERERHELETAPDAERAELAQMYRDRGLSEELSERVADELSQHDRLAVHASTELGIDMSMLANPIQASIVSAVSFILGAIAPIIVTAVSTTSMRVPITIATTLLGLGILGTVGARVGGAPQKRAAARVLTAGVIALLISLAIGRITGSTL